MKKFLKRAGSDKGSSNQSKDTPEARAATAVKAFCDSGSPNNPNGGGDEVVHLPVLVEAAESSPPAAAAAAYNIRKLIRDSYSKPYIQYNAIMLMRILTENPGAPFTRNIDSKFVATIKGCLQTRGDPSVQQILRETLFYFQNSKSDDTNLQPLLTMWYAEQTAYQQQYPVVVPHARGPHAPRPPHHQRPPRASGLPPPEEMASRISEAKTSAQILIQLSQSTPPREVQGNDLMKEFADRVLAANRNLNGYMNCTNPAPDAHTFQTLIETCEQLSVASSKHQRAVLASRQAGPGNLQWGDYANGKLTQGGPNGHPALAQSAPPQQQTFQPLSLQQKPAQRNSYPDPSTSSPDGPSTFSPPSRVNTLGFSPPSAVSTMGSSNSLDPFSDDNRITGPGQQRAHTNGVGSERPPQQIGVPRANTFELAGANTNTNNRPFSGTTSPPSEHMSPTPRSISPPATTQRFQSPHLSQDFIHQNGTTSSLVSKDGQNSTTEDDDDYDLYASGNSPVRERQAETVSVTRPPPTNAPPNTPATALVTPSAPVNTKDWHEPQTSWSSIAASAREQSKAAEAATNSAKAKAAAAAAAKSTSPETSPRPVFASSASSFVRRQDRAVAGHTMSGGAMSPPPAAIHEMD